jgi:hypothetical protein
MADVDPIAAACFVVNALVWNLGPHVYIFHGDTLRHGDHFKQAAEHRAKAVHAWAEVVEQGIGWRDCYGPSMLSRT